MSDEEVERVAKALRAVRTPDADPNAAASSFEAELARAAIAAYEECQAEEEWAFINLPIGREAILKSNEELRRNLEFWASRPELCAPGEAESYARVLSGAPLAPAPGTPKE